MDADEAKADAQAEDASRPNVSAEDLNAEDALGEMAVSDEDDSGTEDAGEENLDEAESDADEDDAADDDDSDESDETSDDDEDSDEESDTDDDGDEAEDGDTADARRQMGARAQKRINKLTAQRNDFREKLDAAEKRLKSLEDRSHASIPLDPDYLSADEAQLIKEANEMLDQREWLMEHIGVGYEDENDESKSLSAKDVAKRLAGLDRASEQIADAQRIYRERKRLQIEDMKAGRALRLSKDAVKTTKAKRPAPPKVKSTSPGQVPKKKPSTSSRRGINLDRFKKNGGGEDAAARELGELVV